MAVPASWSAVERSAWKRQRGSWSAGRSSPSSLHRSSRSCRSCRCACAASATRQPTSTITSSPSRPPRCGRSTTASSGTRRSGRCSSTWSTRPICAASYFPPSTAATRSHSRSRRAAPRLRWPSGCATSSAPGSATSMSPSRGASASSVPGLDGTTTRTPRVATTSSRLWRSRCDDCLPRRCRPWRPGTDHRPRAGAGPLLRGARPRPAGPRGTGRRSPRRCDPDRTRAAGPGRDQYSARSVRPTWTECGQAEGRRSVRLRPRRRGGARAGGGERPVRGGAWRLVAERGPGCRGDPGHSPGSLLTGHDRKRAGPARLRRPRPRRGHARPVHGSRTPGRDRRRARRARPGSAHAGRGDLGRDDTGRGARGRHARNDRRGCCRPAFAGLDRRRRRGLALGAPRRRSWNTRACVKIVCLPGDGIGAEVAAAARDVLSVLVPELEVEEHLFGGAAILATGSPLPDDTLAACLAADAVLLGAVGLPHFDAAEVRPEQGLIGLRKALDVYANLRPARLGAIDLLVVRELVGGLYYGPKGTREDGTVFDTLEYHPSQVERIAHRGFLLARSRRAQVTSVDKANVLETSRMWRRVVTEVAAGYPDVTLEHVLVDTVAMQLVTSPERFDVILTENTFGDILSDEAGAV